MLRTLPLLLFMAVVSCQLNNDYDWTSFVNNEFKPVTENNLLNNINGPSTIVPPLSQNTSGNGDVSCTMDDGGAGKCTQKYLCGKNSTIDYDGVGKIDLREKDGNCNSYLQTCCHPRDVRSPDDPIKPSPQSPRVGCGWRNPEGADMRTTGETAGETKFGEFPWMVAILKIKPDNENKADQNAYIGGGSLIEANVVLTAAHIVATAGALKIRAGEWDTQTLDEIYPFQDRLVRSVVIHKDFNGDNAFYDIALLFLSEPVVLTPNVGVACLPPPRRGPLAGTRCFATGWGQDKFGKEGKYQAILKKVEVPVVDHYTCQTALSKTRLGKFFKLHTSFMCAGGEKDKDTCKGDGGSPLSCPIQYENERYMQSGIVAWGIGCGEEGVPGVYVDVANLRDWIDDKIAGMGLDPKTYTI